MADAGSGLRQELEFLRIKMNAVRVPYVAADPAQLLHIGKRPQANLFQRIILLILRLTQMRVQPDMLVARQDRALTQQILRDRERRTGRQGDPLHGAEGGILVLLNQTHRILHDLIDRLHDAVGRKPSILL